MMTTADVLRRAAQLLRTGGWVQRRARHGDAHCAIGAIEDAARDRGDIKQAVIALGQLLPATAGEANWNWDMPYAVYNGRIVGWNDRADRTAADVIATFEAVAQLLDTGQVVAASVGEAQELELVGV